MPPARPLAEAVLLQGGCIKPPVGQAASPYEGATAATTRADLLLYRRMASLVQARGTCDDECWAASLDSQALLYRKLRAIDLMWLVRAQVRRERDDPTVLGTC